MRRSKSWVWISGAITAVCFGACHDVTESRREDGAWQVAAGFGGVDSHDAGESGAAGAERPPFEVEPDAAAGVGGAAPGDAFGEVAGMAQAGAPDSMQQACVAGVLCRPVDDCWLGQVQCDDGVARCVAEQPAPAGASCAFGECTGDGGCVKPVPSCAGGETAGCGVVTIRGGSFRLGFRAADAAAGAGEPVSVESFALDAYEVTVARFRKFWEARSALVRDVTYPGTHLRVDSPPDEPPTTDQHISYNWSREPALREAHPINRLNWQTAFLFCAWDGGRLPTEAEWEYAATGREVDGLTTGRDFPWGDAGPDCSLANDLSCGSGRTVPVDSFQAWGGLYQMAGNVTEWTADSFTYIPGPCWDGSPRVNPICVEAGNPYYVARGGSFAGTSEYLFGVARLKSQTGTNGRGVRCARDLVGSRTSWP